MNPVAEIKAHLGLIPRTAQDLAESTEMPLEVVYQTLVYLYDRQEARIARKPGQGAVDGWVEGRNA